MDTIKNFLENLGSKANQSSIFLYSVITISTFFLLCLLLSIFLRGYGRAKRAWFLFVVAGICFLQRALTFKLANSQEIFYVLLSMGAIYYSLIFAIRVRRQKPTKEQKELARFIDRQLNRSEKKEEPVLFKDVRIKEEYIPKTVLEKSEDYSLRQNGEYGVDFEHVKSVIDKLEYYGLSQSDKKQVQELSYALIQAENQGFSPLVKSKINDGLGALLKIMSKYGV